jgi:hypothetical protein
MVTFIFGNTVNAKQIEVKGFTMRNAMHWAAIRMGVSECNLVFIGMVEMKRVA